MSIQGIIHVKPGDHMSNQGITQAKAWYCTCQTSILCMSNQDIIHVKPGITCQTRGSYNPKKVIINVKPADHICQTRGSHVICNMTCLLYHTVLRISHKLHQDIKQIKPGYHASDKFTLFCGF